MDASKIEAQLIADREAYESRMTTCQLPGCSRPFHAAARCFEHFIQYMRQEKGN